MLFHVSPKCKTQPFRCRFALRDTSHSNHYFPLLRCHLELDFSMSFPCESTANLRPTLSPLPIFDRYKATREGLRFFPLKMTKLGLLKNAPFQPHSPLYLSSFSWAAFASTRPRFFFGRFLLWGCYQKIKVGASQNALQQLPSPDSYPLGFPKIPPFTPLPVTLFVGDRILPASVKA